MKYNDENIFSEVFSRFAEMILNGESHPLCGENAIQSLEILMSVYESSRIRAQIQLPLLQEEFPLNMMVKNGQL